MAESRVMAGRLLVGTSGFAYPEWKGTFYPEGTKDREMLPVYASRLPSVEINYTFRRQPAEKTLLTWREITPDGFLFTLKAHQRITHTLRLRDAGESVNYFLERARLLGDRLGCVLFQCPPSLKYDRELIEGFLGTLPPELRAAMEFRHPSWTEAKPLLAERGVAWCLAETDETTYAGDALDPGPLAYLRLRKTAYEEDELAAWAARIRAALSNDSDVFCYLKHEDGTVGPRYAETLLNALS